MELLLSLLLLPIIIILILLFIFGIFFFSSLLGIWYRMTGKSNGNATSRGFRTDGNTTSWTFRTGREEKSKAQHQNTTTRTSSHGKEKKKIFAKDEGEYVDFEMIE